MIAKIKTKRGLYDSIVFAIFNKGWKSEVVVFNQDYSALQLVKIWQPKRNVFIYNTEKDNDWIDKQKVEGYGWVLEKITKKYFKTRINDTAILDKCETLQKTVDDCDCFDIKTKTDVDNLLAVSFGFHDSYIKDMYIESGKQYIHFDTTWGCEILFELDGNVETNLFKDFGRIAIGDYYPLIMDSAIFFENGIIHWVDDEYVQSIADLDKSKCHYFCAKNVKWKLIIP